MDTKRIKLLAVVVVIGGLLLHLSAFPVLAGDGSPGWRPMYDLIMRWVNFGILVFLLVRYGRQPLMNYLRGQSDEVATEIDAVDSRKRELQEKIAETRKDIEESSVRFEKIKGRIIEEGERAKEEIIKDAIEQARKLLELEKNKASGRITLARQAFLAELVDTAARHAQDRLPGLITANDHRKMLDHYLLNLNRMAV